MINHVRTLLMNVAGSSQDLSVPGEELLPKQYVPAPLSPGLAAVRARIFGGSPDRWMLNYRLAQLMPLLHASPLVQYVLQPDPRVTYAYEHRDFADESLFVPMIRPVANAETLTLTSDDSKTDDDGKMRHSFRVEILSETEASVARLSAPISTKIAPIENGQIRLHGSGRNARVKEIHLGDSWRIDFLSRPRRDPARIALSLRALSDRALTELFGQQEPYLSFRNLWRAHPELPMHLGGLLLALAYRTEERLNRG